MWITCQIIKYLLKIQCIEAWLLISGISLKIYKCFCYALLEFSCTVILYRIFVNYSSILIWITTPILGQSWDRTIASVSRKRPWKAWIPKPNAKRTRYIPNTKYSKERRMYRTWDILRMKTSTICPYQSQWTICTHSVRDLLCLIGSRWFYPYLAALLL